MVARTPWRIRQVTSMWEARTAEVLASPDLSRIEKVVGAGEIVDGLQLMHNGLKIHEGSYYGAHCSQLLCKTGGVHEPQEELVFQEVLPLIPEGGVMMELGAFWGFYSMWFHQRVPGGRNILVEPLKNCLQRGKDNFDLNEMDAEFIQAFVGKAFVEDRIPIHSIETLMEKLGLEHLNLLHSDIQGAEIDMMNGAENLFARHAIDYLFISTHSEPLHANCVKRLQKHGYEVFTDIPLRKSYSVDGLIVAAAPGMPIPAMDPVTLKPSAN